MPFQVFDRAVYGNFSRGSLGINEINVGIHIMVQSPSGDIYLV